MPSQRDIVYHYCSAQTLLSIVSNSCLWFSDINKMNDAMEMHWSYARFIDAANIVLDEVGRELVDNFDQIFHASQLSLLPFVACFSFDGDKLSQWRAYADDGKGFAIGFDRKKLEELSLNYRAVEYDSKRQVDHYASLLRALREVRKEDTPKEIAHSNEFNEFVTKASIDQVYHKNPAFVEEEEYRMVRAITVKQSKNGSVELVDAGGSGEKVSRKARKVSYRSSPTGLIIPYIEIPFSGLGTSIIREVVIGPKT